MVRNANLRDISHSFANQTTEPKEATPTTQSRTAGKIDNRDTSTTRGRLQDRSRKRVNAVYHWMTRQVSILLTLSLARMSRKQRPIINQIKHNVRWVKWSVTILKSSKKDYDKNDCLGSVDKTWSQNVTTGYGLRTAFLFFVSNHLLWSEATG